MSFVPRGVQWRSGPWDYVRTSLAPRKLLLEIVATVPIYLNAVIAAVVSLLFFLKVLYVYGREYHPP